MTLQAHTFNCNMECSDTASDLIELVAVHLSACLEAFPGREMKEIMKRLSGQPSTGSDSKLVPPVYESTVPNIAFLVSSNGQ